MTAVEALARSAAGYLLVACALAIVTATLLLAAEELGVRQAVNRFGVREWLTERMRWAEMVSSELSAGAKPPDYVRPLRHLPISASSYALPYKQLVAVIGSLVQADLRTGAPYPFARTFAQIGQATMFDQPQTIRPSDFSASSETLGDLNFFAERALDDLQAFLALYTARARYLLSTIAVTAQVVVLWLQGSDEVGPTLGSLFLYPTAIVAAVLFAPVIRDALERIGK